MGEPSPDTTLHPPRTTDRRAQGARRRTGNSISEGLVEGNAWDCIGAYPVPRLEGERTSLAPPKNGHSAELAVDRSSLAGSWRSESAITCSKRSAVARWNGVLGRAPVASVSAASRLGLAVSTPTVLPGFGRPKCAHAMLPSDGGATASDASDASVAGWALGGVLVGPQRGEGSHPPRSIG